MPVSPARAAAFEILMRIETTDAYASEMLHSARAAKLSPEDHGLLTELVMGVLRWRGVLDFEIAERTKSLAKMDREVLSALRLGVYQLLFLDRIPRHAIINESVELVKRARKRSAAGMVNAVLRKVADSHSVENSHVSQNRRGPPNLLSSHPQWLVQRWERTYGSEFAEQICEYDQAAPETVVRFFNPHFNGENAVRRSSSSADDYASAFSDQIGPAAQGQSRAAVPTLDGRDSLRASPPTSALDQLAADGIEFELGKLLCRAALVKSGEVTQTKVFREHSLAIQDEASQLVALLVGTGTNVLDCCAAPGGKTRIIAERNPNASVVAMDLHPHRARLLRKLVSEPNVLVVAGDARRMPLAKKFDRILVDAPCSGTGTLARNPEIKWRLTPEDIVRLQTYQIEILTAAMQHVTPGGRIIYSTCSLEPEENEIVVQGAIEAEPSFKVIDSREELQRLREDGELVWSNTGSLLSGPYLRTIPGVHPCDGFFAAILVKS